MTFESPRRLMRGKKYAPGEGYQWHMEITDLIGDFERLQLVSRCS